MKLENDIKLDFNDVLFRPKRSTFSSRSEVNVERTFNFKHSKRSWTGVPIISSNMDTVSSIEMFKSLSKYKCITCFHKYININEIITACKSGYSSEYFMLSTGITDKDYTKLIHAFAKYADYLVINISSPNTPNLRKLHSDKNFKNLIISIKKEINKLNNCPPILIKISPDLSNTELKKIIKETVKHKLHGLIISNTTIKRNVKSKYKEETGGLSGEPLFEESTKVLIKARKILNDFGSPISIIATGGVYDGKSAYIKILCGADLIQLYTGLVYKGPFVVKNILDQLDRFRKRDNIKKWEDVTGLAKSINEAIKIVENGLNKKR